MKVSQGAFRIAWVLLILAATAFGQAEVRRPTSDVDAFNNLQFGCMGVNQSSGGMGFAYDGAGESTSANQSVIGGTTRTNSSITYFKTRKFKAWQSGRSYSALELHVSASTTMSETTTGGSLSGLACVVYSTDAGATWSGLNCIDDGDLTGSVELPANQDMSKLQVGVCMQADSAFDGGTTERLRVADIWTVGVYSAAPGGGAETGSTNGMRHGLVIIH